MENEKNYYVERTIITPAGESVGTAGPFTKEQAEQFAYEETYSLGQVRQYAKVIQK